MLCCLLKPLASELMSLLIYFNAYGLVAQNANVDELDYLAKRLDGFDKDEGLQFQAMASVLGLSDIKDLINLTFARFVP